MRQYKQRTKHLGIPVVGDGDSLWGDVELSKWQFVENLLLSATRGLWNCVYNEGDYHVERQPDGLFNVCLSAMNGTPAAEGVSGGIFFCVGTKIVWEGLIAGHKYFLYVSTTNKTYQNPSEIRTVFSRFDIPRKRNLLMAVVDLSQQDVSIDNKPEGKAYADSLATPARHMPVEIVDSFTGGKNGTKISAGGKIMFIQTCLLSNDIGKAGEMTIGYHGQDSNVEKQHDAIVYNTGSEKIPFRALIYCR